ncbi:MAG: hypothetical protein AAF655_18540 [Bacteroidota bacterium]
METNTEDPYVIEITTFTYKEGVKADTFWIRDAKIQEDYTSKQPGFISRESAMSEEGEVVVVVRWKTMADAEASMNKFMQDPSVADYAQMIEGPSMKMKRYQKQ